MTLPKNESSDDSAAQKYAVIVSDLADAEARSAYQWLQENASPEYAGRWLEGLTRAIEGLAFLPRSHAVARENDRYDVEIRRMLYPGPSKRRGSGGTTYRILFHIIETSQEDAEGVVRILHIWHGSIDE